jgi:hypothetical protein
MEKGEIESLGLAPISPEALDIVNPPTDTPFVKGCICRYIDLYFTDKNI